MIPLSLDLGQTDLVDVCGILKAWSTCLKFPKTSQSLLYDILLPLLVFQLWKVRLSYWPNLDFLPTCIFSFSDIHFISSTQHFQNGTLFIRIRKVYYYYATLWFFIIESNTFLFYSNLMLTSYKSMIWKTESCNSGSTHYLCYVNEIWSTERH